MEARCVFPMCFFGVHIMPTYLVRHGPGYRYFRNVPKALRSLIGAPAWTQYSPVSLSLGKARAKALMLAAPIKPSSTASSASHPLSRPPS
jgi:hypothetical protein